MIENGLRDGGWKKGERERVKEEDEIREMKKSGEGEFCCKTRREDGRMTGREKTEEKLING